MALQAFQEQTLFPFGDFIEGFLLSRRELCRMLGLGFLESLIVTILILLIFLAPKGLRI